MGIDIALSVSQRHCLLAAMADSARSHWGRTLWCWLSERALENTAFFSLCRLIALCKCFINWGAQQVQHSKSAQQAFVGKRLHSRCVTCIPMQKRHSQTIFVFAASLHEF